VLKEQIARPQSIKTMQTILTHVVSQGLGKRAGSPKFSVAGKTGTAQVSDKEFNYHTGIRCHWLSFCGYFPADKPRYSCIVCVKTTNGPASGGLVSGSVFHEISEGVMSKSIRAVIPKEENIDLAGPDVKPGDPQAAGYVLKKLGLKADEAEQDSVSLAPGTMPSVVGMGARDAVFLLEQLGLKVRLSGTGNVQGQSIPKGTTLQKGMSCQLRLGS
jgi:cell division protein FtsI (penicillin-binding protein 3)